MNAPIDAIYEQLGEEAIGACTASFYRRVKEDDILAPMYPEGDWEGAEQRLRDFLVFRFGGPSRYIEQRGHPRLRRRHMPFPIDAQATARWLELMQAALDEAIEDQDLRGVLYDFFHQVAHFLQNRRP